MSDVKRFVAVEISDMEYHECGCVAPVCVLASDYDALKAQYDEQAALIESLQNRWASRPLSVEDTAELEKDAARWQWLTDHRRQGRWKFQRWSTESGQWSDELQEMGEWIDIDPSDLREHVDLFLNPGQSGADGGSES